LVAKIESSTGVDSSPVGGTNFVQLMSIEVTPIESDNVEPDTYLGFLGNSTRPTILARKRARITCEVELAGSGVDPDGGDGTQATAPAYAPLLQACGLSVSGVDGASGVTYAPASDPNASANSSCTIYCWYNLTRHKFVGVRGTFSLSYSSGQVPTISFEMTGEYAAPDSTAMSGTRAVANQAAGLEFNDTNVTTATFHAQTNQRIESFDFAMNNDYDYKETASSGEVLVFNRNPGGTVVVEAPVRSSLDYFARTVGTDLASTSIVLGATQGNIVTLTLPYTDITGISYGDTNGIRNLSMPYLARPNATGNNEMSLLFS
jgi:hypothetical protein